MAYYPSQTTRKNINFIKVFLAKQGLISAVDISKNMPKTTFAWLISQNLLRRSSL